MKPSLAVLITYHDERHLLTRCVESLMSQSDAPDEIWIYDDASVYPASRYVPAELRQCVIRGDRNLGPACGRNNLVATTKCAFVHFHDADDWFFPDWSVLVRRELGSNTDVVFTEVSSFVDGKLAGRDVVGLTSQIASNDQLIRFAIRHALLVPSGTYRRVLVESLGGYRESIWQSEDWDFHVRVALGLPRFTVVSRSLVGIDVRAASRSQKRSEVWSSQLEAIALLQREAPADYHRDLAETAARASGELYRLGRRAEAAKGFDLAASLGRPTFEGRPPVYRVLASLISPLFAERVARSYRGLLPDRLRSIMRRPSKPAAA
jgi:glycosyltransferase involved in cell wall biosynthesis